MIRLGFWFRTALSLVLRSRRSSAVLSLMVLSAVASLIFLSALMVGVNDAMIRNSVGLFMGHVSAFDLPATIEPADLQTDGVKSLLKRVPRPGILFGQDRVETAVLMEVDPVAERRSSALWKKTTAGSYLEAGQKTIFLSETLAASLGTTVGAQVRFAPNLETSPAPLEVRGLYRTGVEQLDRGMAFVPTGAIDAPVAAWQAALFLEDGVDPEALLELYRKRDLGPARFASWTDLMPDLRQLIDLNYVSMTLVTVLVFGVVALGISCAFVVFILGNLREYGIMKAMGVTSVETACLIGFQVILINLIAAAAGVVIGAAFTLAIGRTGIDLSAFTSHNQYFAVSGVVYPRLTVFALGLPPLLSFIFGLLATVWPTILVMRKRTAQILRSL